MSLLCVGDALVSQWRVVMLRWCFGHGLWCFGDEHWWAFSDFQWVPTQKAWLFHVSLLLGSYAGLIFTIHFGGKTLYFWKHPNLFWCQGARSISTTASLDKAAGKIQLKWLSTSPSPALLLQGIWICSIFIWIYYWIFQRWWSQREGQSNYIYKKTVYMLFINSIFIGIAIQFIGSGLCSKVCKLVGPPPISCIQGFTHSTGYWHTLCSISMGRWL